MNLLLGDRIKIKDRDTMVEIVGFSHNPGLKWEIPSIMWAIAPHEEVLVKIIETNEKTGIWKNLGRVYHLPVNSEFGEIIND